MVLEINGIHKSFGAKHVLQDVSFKAQGGQAFGLLGRNGAGKTTSIRVIMGVFPADAGSIMLDGAPLDRGKLSIGYLPEEHGLYPKKAINVQLQYLAELRGMQAADARSSIKHWLGRLGMGEYANKKLITLSKGNQQKIQLACTLITNPDIIILDEPFSGLDPVNAALLKDVVREVIAEGKIVLFSSHQMSYVEEFCDNIAILHEGKIVLSGGLDEIKRSYSRDVICVGTRQRAEVEAFCDADDTLVETILPYGRDLMVKLRSPEQKNALMEALASTGLDIDSMGVYEPTLNDIFVEYTGDGEDEA